MTREKYKAMLPIIEAFANGETVECYNNATNKWVASSLYHFDGNIEDYRIVKDGRITYFGNRRVAAIEINDIDIATIEALRDIIIDNLPQYRYTKALDKSAELIKKMYQSLYPAS